MKKMIPILILFPWVANPLFSQDILTQLIPKNVHLSFNGTFVHNGHLPSGLVYSENGRYWCEFEIGHVGDEVRELKRFRLFEDDRLLYELAQPPGSDFYISNSGFCAFLDMRHHYRGELTIYFYSETGRELFFERLVGASLFGFSPKGTKFGVGNSQYLKIISVPDRQIESYDGADQFDISEDEKLVAIALRGKARVYSENNLIGEFNTGFIYPRKIKVSSEHQFLAVIDKKHLKVYSLINGKLLFEDVLDAKRSFRDLILQDGQILAGIQDREKGISSGILKVYDQQGRVLIERIESSKSFKTFDQKKLLQKSPKDYNQIPWPFIPFDSVHTVWNYYEQHMSYGLPDWSYLHQGLDIIVPMNEPTFAVEAGIVKCVLTISGYWHWRIAVSQEQTSDFSKGWLYAHLIPSTIQFDVGDTVQQHDYLGDIVQWHDDWGHIHFVEIQDSGLVWRYDDNEWGITYNPLLSLQPNTDLIPPMIEPVFEHSKFVFCLNETSDYLDPDSLYGDVDIIAKIVDYIGDSPWQLPAYEIFYWVKKLPEDTIVVPRTLGQILNHAYDFYDSHHYTPFATVIYKRDSLLLPPHWMDLARNYYHILTNNNGDSLIDLSEKDLALSTDNFPNGVYRIFVEARDQFGNTTVDSMDVKFKNRTSDIGENQIAVSEKLLLIQNYPNPFNTITEIYYVVPKPGIVSIKILDLLGKEVCELVDRYQSPGSYQVEFQADGLASGIYFCQLKTAIGMKWNKMVLLR
ncbi:MAG: T9SS type A sorting domain-containing protein [candidate division KSB1 bacterium]|nr:T9SS type A sorting domain-containing protein [candidate division KSB1 bacterium]MDZ7336412.1 T9SS type A sorting domain-containing protein [candidate division KSB1 bacterium]MDZ7358411.1 T9SS type A sorting domain-containing protein [candidate division KSB1 bacterium]MDZ7401902.1 T9SS type A sorting domain-containing protein [candidate division KSB1 bacterium]